MGLKPKLGETVYLPYHISITVKSVYALGEKSFIRSDFDDATYLSDEYRFDDHNKRWFTDLDKAKAFLMDKFKSVPGNKKIVQHFPDYYELEISDI